MLADDENKRKQQLMRQMLIRGLVPGFTRDDLMRMYFRSDNDSNLMFAMAFEELNKRNETPIARRFHRHPKTAAEYSVQEMYSRLRFTHEEFQTLMISLGIPNYFRFERRVFTGEEALLLLLRRLSCVTTFEKLRQEFRREESELCVGFNGMIKWMNNNHGWLITGKFTTLFTCIIIVFTIFLFCNNVI